MFKTVQIDQAAGSGPTWTTNGTTTVWNRSEDNATTNHIQTPTSTGTTFSYVKTLSIDITRTNNVRKADLKLLEVVDARNKQVIWHSNLGGAAILSLGPPGLRPGPSIRTTIPGGAHRQTRWKIGAGRRRTRRWLSSGRICRCA